VFSIDSRGVGSRRTPFLIIFMNTNRPIVRWTALTTLMIVALTVTRSMWAGASKAMTAESRDSLAIELGPDVTVPLGPDAGALSVEPTVAIRDSIVVVAWNDSHGGHLFRGYHDIGTAVSVDRGRTYRFLHFLPDTAGGVRGASDPRLIVDSRGTFSLAMVSNGVDQQQLRVYALDGPDYTHWRFVSIADRVVGIFDNPAFIRTEGDALELAYMRDFAIVLTESRDRGQTWSAPRRLSDSTVRTRSGTAIRACGADVEVDWMEGGGNLVDEVWGTTSHDRGRRFVEPRLRYPLARVVPVPRGYALGPGQSADMRNDVGLICSAGTGRLARTELMYAEGVADRYGRVLSSRVGTTYRTVATDRWSTRELFDPRDTASTFHVFPTIAATRAMVGVLDYELSIDAQHTVAQTVLHLRGVNGAASRVVVADTATDWRTVKGDLEFSPGQHNFGDYISLAADDNSFAAAWTDGRNGRSRIHVRVVRARH
jgi:hypothetical protein